jgi:hypothetical protein
MSDVQLSAELIRFIQTTLPSYDAAVMLVRVSRDPERAWTAEGLAGAMGLDASSAPEVRQLLEHFANAGVLEAAGEGTFRLVPETGDLRAVVDELRTAYDRRPVTLIRAIDSASRAKIQSFADSFKLKRDRE